MKTFRVSTVTLAYASIEVKAEDSDAALEAASNAPGAAWSTGEVFGEVDLEGECVVVEEVRREL